VVNTPFFATPSRPEVSFPPIIHTSLIGDRGFISQCNPLRLITVPSSFANFRRMVMPHPPFLRAKKLFMSRLPPCQHSSPRQRLPPLHLIPILAVSSLCALRRRETTGTELHPSGHVLLPCAYAIPLHGAPSTFILVSRSRK